MKSIKLTVWTTKEYSVIANWEIGTDLKLENIYIVKDGKEFDVRNFKCKEEPKKWISQTYRDIAINNRAEWLIQADEMISALNHPGASIEIPKIIETPAGDNGLIKEVETAVAKMAKVMSRENEIRETVETAGIAAVKKFIAENYGPIKRVTNIIDDGKTKVEIPGIIHHKLQRVLAYVMKDQPVFMTGPAGSGKNIMASQIAEILKIPYHTQGAVTQKHELTGFINANGGYHPTEFYKAFTNGGLFLLDEIDGSTPEVLITINAAIANRYYEFPTGRKDAHKDFRVIAAGNTYGTGADMEYTGRNPLDAATLDRFATVIVGYDNKIDMAISNDNRDLCEYIWSLREAVEKAGIKRILSPRAISRMTDMESDGNYDGKLEDLIQECIFRQINPEDVRYINTEYSGDRYNRYFQATLKVAGIA